LCGRPRDFPVCSICRLPLAFPHLSRRRIIIPDKHASERFERACSFRAGARAARRELCERAISPFNPLSPASPASRVSLWIPEGGYARARCGCLIAARVFAVASSFPGLLLYHLANKMFKPPRSAIIWRFYRTIKGTISLP